jgi:hypothetical protein
MWDVFVDLGLKILIFLEIIYSLAIMPVQVFRWVYFYEKFGNLI